MSLGGWLPPGASWAGDATVEGPVRIEGHFVGTLKCTDFVDIASSGHVDGHIDAAQVLVAGTVDGRITARERVTLLETARLRGDLTTPWLDVAVGATWVGTVQVVRTG